MYGTYNHELWYHRVHNDYMGDSILIYAMFDILTCLHDLWQGFALDKNCSWYTM